MADLIKHGELSVQQIAHIQKDLLVGLRKKGQFWDSFCSHTQIPAGTDKIEWRKLNVPELTPAEVADLVEGVTPAALQLEYVKFAVTPADYGDWMAYTDKSKRYNYDDVVRDGKLVLRQRAVEEAEIRKARQFIGGTCTMDLTTGTDAFLKDLLKARTYLTKNHAKPIKNGKFGCILTPEQAADVLVKYKDSITHTAEKEAILEGYIGELGGFMLFENADKIMYKVTEDTEAVAAVAGTPLAENAPAVVGTKYYTRAANGDGAGYLNDGTYKYTIVETVPETHAANTYYPLTNVGADAIVGGTTGYCLFIGRTDYGMPVQTVAFGDDAVEVYDNGLGSIPQYDADNGGLRPDALHQRGSIGFKVMGFATRILADEAIIRAEFTIDGGEVDMEIVDANRQHYVTKAKSPVRA